MGEGEMFAMFCPKKKIEWSLALIWFGLTLILNVLISPAVSIWCCTCMMESWMKQRFFCPSPRYLEFKLFAQMSGRAYRATKCFRVISLTHSLIHSVTKSLGNILQTKITPHTLLHSYIMTEHDIKSLKCLLEHASSNPTTRYDILDYVFSCN